jgi:CRP-like cAMP-binding protein
MIASMPAVEESLARVPLFEGLTERDLRKLGQAMKKRTFAAGDEVTAEGKSGIGFFVVEDGTAAVSVKGSSVGTVGPGDHFGEVALIDRGPRSATIVAESELRCRVMTAWEFKPFMREQPEIAWRLLEGMAARLREAEER